MCSRPAEVNRRTKHLGENKANRWTNVVDPSEQRQHNKMQQVNNDMRFACAESRARMRPTTNRKHSRNRFAPDKMSTGNFYLQVLAQCGRICLAVILVLHNVVQAHEIMDTNQLMHHSQRGPAMFKDLSGPMSGKIQTLDVICGKNFMTVRAEFSAPFYGIVFSKGTYGHENCIYVKPNSGLTHAAFNVYYDQCGTKPDLQGKFYENTIVIQYGSDIIEAYDEAKRLRCEWFEAYEKPATFKPAIPVADLEVVEMNFQGDDIDCWMEIQDGSGPWSREVNKIVPVGQPMTIVVAINDYNGQFDMRVKSCVAHDGVQQPIALTDEFGCVLRPKMLTPFTKIRNSSGAQKKATVLSYSRFLAFKFPDSMTVQIQCTVEVCRNGCADACQRVPSIAATTMQPELSLSAKWPAASNQAALEGAPAWPASASNRQAAYASSRPQLTGSGERRPPMVNYGAQPSVPSISHNSPQLLNDQPALPEELSSSDSNQAPSVIPHQRQSPPQGYRRSPEANIPSFQLNGMLADDGRVPQYLVPNTRRVPPTFGSVLNNRQQQQQQQQASTGQDQPEVSSTPQTLSTEESQPPSTTTTTTPTKADQVTRDVGTSTNESTEDLSTRASSTEEPVSPAEAKESQEGPQVDDQVNPNVEKGSQVASVPADNKPEASQVIPTVMMPDESSLTSNQQTSDQVESKPSVQADEVNAAESKAIDRDSGSALSSSSLKTVEVEIPADEDSNPSGPSAQPGSQFNSVRLNNAAGGDGASGASIYTVPLETQLPQRQNMMQNRGSYQSPEQVIQPRESPTFEKGDKNEESNIEAMIATGKSQFGARSQPHSIVNQNYQSENPAANHRPAEDQSHVSSDSSDTMDRVSIDRSDDSSSLAEGSGAAPQVAPVEGESSIKPSMNGRPNSDQADTLSASASDSESIAMVAPNADPNKIKPVVGTEELASGPLQIEDRIGAPAQDSLEEALSKLQQQIPQTAALISSGQSQTAQLSSINRETPMRSDSGPNPAASAPAPRSDTPVSALPLASNQHVGPNQSSPSGVQGQAISGSQMEGASPRASSSNAINQPYPNVMGQSKIIADPNSGSRGSLQPQATNIEMAPNVVRLPVDGSSLRQPEVGGSSSKPIAQITNVPIAIGYPNSQMPVSAQQLSQQIAYLQQQQQQQPIQQRPHQEAQQKQQRQTTAKPRGRFSLLSPQAALHAVASRFLPKSQSQQHQQHNQQIPSSIQHLNLYNNNNNQYGPQSVQQHQAHKLFTANLNQMQNVQLQPRLQVPMQRLTAPQQSNYGHYSPGFQHQINQQPLKRIRRSAMMSKSGQGEVGMTKTFMVVTGLDLNFQPNSSELPPIFEGRRAETDVIYGVCMPIMSLTFVLTCVFWFFIFITCFCIYMFIKSRRLRRHQNGADEFVKQPSL